MGIMREPLQFVRDLRLPKGFSVCELGDQWITQGYPQHRLAAEFYREIGCGRYESIDGNGRGTKTHDLNASLKGFGKFDLVTDFGTGEHVFDQCQVWKTVHYLTNKNGFIAFDRPTQGYPVHCYYNVNECLFTDLAAANDYRVIKLERCKTSRGELIRGVFKKTTSNKFNIPQQGRYKKLLRPITEKST